MGSRNHPVTTTVTDAIEFAYGAFSDLHDEIDEVVSNMEDSEGLQATSRYETLSETRDTLAEYVDMPDIPDGVSDVEVTYTVDTRRRESSTRRGQRDNAVNALSAAKDVLADWLSTTQERMQALDDASESDGDEYEELESLTSEVEELINTLEEAQDAVEGVEFPGMYG